MGKKIVFVNQDTGYLMIDIINAFVEKFNKVVLIAGRVRVQHIPLDSRVEYAKIIRYNKGSQFNKYFSSFVGIIQIFFLLIFKYRKFELFYVTVPPMSYFLSYFLKNKFSVLVFDVYPDAFKVSNMHSGNLIYKLWSFVNKAVFAKSYRIFTLSEGQRKLLCQYVQKDKVIVVPGWSNDLFKPLETKNNKFALEHDLLSKFVILYAGNMTKIHNVEVLIEVARRLKDHDDVLFLIASNGEKVKKIRRMAIKYNLRNCKFLPFQVGNAAPLLFSSADIGVIVLKKELALVGVPSRIYNFMAVGSPILGIVSQESEVSRLILEYNNGGCFDQADIKGISDFILRLKSDKKLHAESINNSIKASKNFTVDNVRMYLNHYV